MPTKDELYDAGVDLVADGKVDEAIEKYKAAIALDADFADGWQALALAYQQLARYDDAIAAAEKLVALTPDDELAHTTLSRVLQAAGKVPEAEAAGAKARILSWKRQLAEPKSE